ncbi:MAG: IS4 family transposase [Gammaproteobacteria bacterium]|nr:IS4 family transposase [Gammaproteobacteria bacterium]
MKHRLTPLIHTLTQNTVLEEWFKPMQAALDRVRYPEKVFATLTIPAFLLLGSLRQLQAHRSLREQVQSLMHFDNRDKPPLARSTWSDALASKKRAAITREAFSQLVNHARTALPDRFTDMPNLGERKLIAIDASYQTESAHYQPVYPKAGGTDNQKGHMLMTFYDLRKGIPLDVKTETTSRGEMRVIKEALDHSHWMAIKNALYSVDRAFIDVRYWDERKRLYRATMVTRFKSILVYQETRSRPIAKRACNDGVISDLEITLRSSKQRWRRIEFMTEAGDSYAYLTNDFSLEPGELAFIYHRRWDEEKFFDNFKNDLTNAKAWGKSPTAIDQQTVIGIITYILTRLFLDQQFKKLALQDGNTTQTNKHKKKVECYQKEGGISLRAYWFQMSKIPVQVWRFFKNCFLKEPSIQLYERQLKPILMRYL